MTEPGNGGAAPVESCDIDHPTHYNHGDIEAITAISSWKLGFCLGNVIKYVVRSSHKGSYLDDLKKARWYLNRAIEESANDEKC